MKSFIAVVQLFALVLCQPQYCCAQDKDHPAPRPVVTERITHGPIIGAVTDHSAKMYFRTSSSVEFHVLIYNDDNTLFANIAPTTQADYDTSVIIPLDNLSPDYTYHYDVFLKGNLQRSGSFRTFPTVGTHNPFSFAFGSCMEHDRGDSIFIELQKQKPAFFLHLGDWTYPDHEGYPNNVNGGNNRFYSTDYKNVQEAYRVRYSLPNMNKFLASTPIDFIYDDDDFVFDENSRNTQSCCDIINGKTVLYEKPLPPGARYNAIKGYMDCFPHYPIEHDTANGVYHKFRYGNVEVFFLDSRADRSSENEAFKVSKSGKLTFAPDSNHTILGKEQMAWLLNGLLKSTADWKFIVSGTNFNMGYRRAIDLALLQQKREVEPGRTAAGLAASMCAMWVGFPYDQAKLINHCADNKIKNVIVLSGDAHSSSIDDGTNAGLPELVGSNLSVPNSKIPSILYNRVGLDLWNKGGQGIGNDNYNNCFGKVEVYGQDSVQLNVVDEHGVKVASCILKNGIVAKHVDVNTMAGTNSATKKRRREDLFRLISKQMHEKRKH